MSKFKKGDWVRVLHTDFEDEFPVDSVAQVHEADRVVFLMHASGKLCFYDSELEPWQPKVGDRVRMIKEVDGEKADCGATVVEILGYDQPYRITFDERQSWVDSYGWWVNADDIEPLPAIAAPVAAEAQPAADTQASWAPKVGDRVTVSWGHGWNGEGVVTAVYEKTANVVMDSGDLAGAEGGFTFAYLKPFRIESGRYYRTRDGRKVGPMVPTAAIYGHEWKFTVDHDFGSTLGKAWRADGTFNTARGNQHDADFIALWQDEPAAAPATAAAPRFTAKPLVAATVDYQADEYGSGVKAEPKFRVGDKVDYLRDRDGQWLGVTIDRVEMTSFGTMGYWGRGKNGHTGLFEGDDIVLSRPITQPTAIVARIDNGQPKPASRPYVHHSQEAAAKEAERLANVHRGKKFGVYVLTGEPAFVEREYKFTWQKMAARNDVPAAIDELSRAAGIARSDAHFAVRNWLEAA